MTDMPRPRIVLQAMRPPSMVFLCINGYITENSAIIAASEAQVTDAIDKLLRKAFDDKDNWQRQWPHAQVRVVTYWPRNATVPTIAQRPATVLTHRRVGHWNNTGPAAQRAARAQKATPEQRAEVSANWLKAMSK